MKLLIQCIIILGMINLRIKWHNSTMAIIKYQHMWLKSLDEGAKSVRVIEFDFSKAFDSVPHDLLVSTPDKHLYVVELTVVFESNLTNNVNRKKAKYKNLIRELDQNFTSVKFINLSVSSLGVFDKECHTFVKMLNELGLDNQHQQYCIRKIISIAIRSTYYIFCCRNKEWTNSELMNI